ncbi:MFS transporter [Chloroflexota bacterium]
MIKRRRFPKIYFGWWMNLAMGLLSGSAGGFTQQGISVIFKPIASELGLSRAATSVATAIARFEGGIESPITGGLSDKFGPKWVVFTGTCFMIIGLVWMNFIHSVWAYYVAWGVIIATGHNLGFTIAHDKVLTDWFVSKRGLAFGVRFAILGAMGVIVLPIVSWLVITQGWRMTCLIWAVVIFAGIPFALYFVKQKRPEYYGLLPDGAAVEPGSEADIGAMIAKGVEYAASFHETEFTLKQAMRTSSYWMLVLSKCANGMIYGAINLHCIPFLTDMGIAPVVAAGMMAMMVFFTIPSRFLGGVLADRFTKERLRFLLMGAFLIQVLGITTFLLNQTVVTAYVFLILLGFGSGTMTPVDISTKGRYFGRKSYGSIQGTSNSFAAMMSLFAPVYTGWVYDVSGSYLTAFTTFAAIAAFGAFIVYFLRPPKPPAHVVDPRRLM